MSAVVRPLQPADRDWVRRFTIERWGAETVVGHGTVYHPADLPGFFALVKGEPVGLVTYHLAGTDCEIVTIDSLRPGQGIGTTLIAKVEDAARQAGCRRVWLTTTNDNLDALRFYQKRGFVLTALHRGAVERARRVKPELPLVGDHGIPLRDEIELELPLTLGTAVEQEGLP